MTVQDMDITLNISAEPAAKKSARDSDNSILDLMRANKARVEKNKTVNDKKPKSEPVKDTGIAKKRVKQKHLGVIVAQRLKGANVISQIQSTKIPKNIKPTEHPLDRENKQSQQEVFKASIEVDKNDSKISDSLSNKHDEGSGMPVITFTKVTKENFGKTLLAKKRDNANTDSKKTLSSIFSKRIQSENKEISLLDSLQKSKGKSDSIPKQISKLDESETSPNISDKVSVNKKRRKPLEKKPTENDGNVAEHKSRHAAPKSIGKISSLFGQNPEIPNIGQRLVKPIHEPVFSETTFTDLNVHPFTISNLEQNMSIAKMTTVQQKAIPQILSGKDVLIRSQTGSGKTLAYALPIVECLHKIRPKLSRTSGLNALVVVPTRELALQTYECFLKLIKPFTWIVPGYLAGGEKRKAEKARLRKGCNILVGTPGRLLDHIKRTAALKLSDVKYFVLDEADRMFDMGYEKDISGIVSALKVSTPNENTGYDPINMLRHNTKQVFSDEDVHERENSVEKESHIKLNKEVDSESEDKRNIRQKQEYHSSSDNDSDDGEPYIKSKKADTRKTGIDLTEKKKSNQEKDNTQQKENNRSGGSWTQTQTQTILLSATLTQAVEKLAGLAMDHPIFVDAAKENLETSGGDASDINEDLVVPQSVVQSYIVTPAKLRMVTLSAYIAGKCQSHGEHKILIFMATQDMVDYHAEILSAVLTKPADEDDDDSDPLVDVEFFKLHGNMTQRERTEVFKIFRQSKSGVLLCTDVAARGLDLPKVDCVVQYTGPTSARDYVHRIGRTARAGCSGSATIFLTPTEIEFVRMLESRRIRIKQVDMDDILDKLVGPLSKHSSTHNAAVALQNEFENMILEDSKLRDKAYKAYTSWIRFYSSYPREMREIFNRREVHLGHYAKSFALRETPQRIGGVGKKLHEKDNSKKQHNNRLTNEQPDGEPAKKQKRQRDEPKMGLLKRVRMLNTSEYSSGLQPAKKPKKS